jgi:hypothetical protein
MTALAYVEALLNDETASASRRDRAAFALLNLLARQGGLGKRELTKLGAKSVYLERNSPWWDEEAGKSLLDPNWPLRRKSKPEPKVGCEELLGPPERSMTEWLNPETGESDLTVGPFRSSKND